MSKFVMTIDYNEENKQVRYYESKPQGLEYGKIQNRLIPMTLTLQTLRNNVLKGMAFKPAWVTGTKDSDFKNQQVFVIDIDNDNDCEHMTVDECLHIANENNVPVCWSYYTFSHDVDKPKFRLLFMSDTIVNNPNDVIMINKWLISLFRQSDDVCWNLGKLFQGTNKGQAIEVNDKYFHYLDILERAKAYDEANKKTAPIKENKPYYAQGDDPKELVKEYSLNYLESYRAKVTGYICPSCGSGGGDNGTGITQNPYKPSLFKCFACEWNGDIIDYHMDMNGLDFHDSLMELCGMFNIECSHNTTPQINNKSSLPLVTAPTSSINTPPSPTNENKNDDTKEEVIVMGKMERLIYEALNNMTFIPNYTITFIEDKVVLVPTGGGKTYNLIQICLDQIINHRGKKIIICTATNDLIDDFASKLAIEIRKLLQDNDDLYDISTDELLDYLGVLKLTVDTEKIDDFSQYNVIVTNQSYLFPIGDTVFYSKKFGKLMEVVNENKNEWSIYIDECHMLERYKYSHVEAFQLTRPNNNSTRTRTTQKVNYYFYKDENEIYHPSDLYYKKALIQNEDGVMIYQYVDDGLIDVKEALKKAHQIKEKVVLKKNCLKRLEDGMSLWVYDSLIEVDFLFGDGSIGTLRTPQSNFEEFIEHSTDKYIIQSYVVLCDKNGAEIREFENHKKFFDFAMEKEKEQAHKLLSLLNAKLKNGKELFSTVLHLEKPQIQLNCSCHYTTATADNISKKYEIVKVETENKACGIENIEVIFCSLDLFKQLRGKSTLNIVTLDALLTPKTNIILSEKRKVEKIEKYVKGIQEPLNRTVIHFEKETKLLIDDTKVNTINSDIKIGYLEESRQTGTDFLDTELILLDCNRSINANQKYNRYIKADGELYMECLDDTDIIFNLTKQSMGRLLRGNIKNKMIVVCLPDNETMTSSTFFKTDGFTSLFGNYFALNFPQINMTYRDFTSMTNKEQQAVKVVNRLGMEVTTNGKKTKRNDEIFKRCSELNEQGFLTTEKYKQLAEEFQLKERQLKNIVSEHKPKFTKKQQEELVIYWHERGQTVKDIVNICNDDFKIGKSTVSNIIKKYKENS